MTHARRDSRLEAFCSRNALEVFHSICHRHDIFREDPLDVDEIHAEARDAFERLVHQATTPPGVSSGRILLLKGEAGAGKTHLMRAFRWKLHSRGLGYFGYMQMTSGTQRYAEYVLSNLIASLEQPYRDPAGVSALMRLSQSLVEHPDAVPEEMAEMLRDDQHFVDGLPRKVDLLANHIISQERFAKLDVDLVRALLYLQRSEPKITQRVLSWLRCEDLAPQDRALIGGMVPRLRDDDPERMIEQLGRLIWAVEGAALVLCIDQLEDMYQSEQAEVRFRRAMSTVCSIADRIPNSIIVISCLEDYFESLRQHLTAPLRDRIERDPDPVILVSGRKSEEIEQLVVTRLRHLYERLDAPFYQRDPTYPFPKSALQKWANLRTRDVLDACRGIRDEAIRLGTMPPIPEAKTTGPEQPTSASEEERAVLALEQQWNDFFNAWKQAPSDDDPELASLLARSIETCAAELESGHRFLTSTADRMIEVDVLTPSGEVSSRYLIAVCNAGSQGGGLGRQVEEAQAAAKGKKRTPVLVRSSDYPSNPRSKVAHTLGKFITEGGRRVTIEAGDWRAMRAHQAFLEENVAQEHLLTWRAAENPLSRLHGIREVLALDSLPPVDASVPGPASDAGSPRASATATGLSSATDLLPISDTALLVGRSNDLFKKPVTLEVEDLKQHAAFLGGSGSGKTTLAMNVIEQLLERGVPAILLDRKGDLASYAHPSTWTSTARDSAHAKRREALHAKLDVGLYTPGNPAGRSLSLSIAPRDLRKLPPHEREQVTRCAAFALGSMLDYKPQSRSDKSSVAILGSAILLLSESGQEVTVDTLLDLIAQPDPSLVQAVGHLDTKLFRKLANDLQTLKLNGGPLVGQGERMLDVDELLGRGAHTVPGKTRLSVISTKFLGDNATILFFVSQLLMELARWSSRNASTTLQGVLLADEADLYLPSTSKPATKEPMENLLKRARSAGLSVMLATQSPGDLDYKCRDTIRSWFVGRVKEQTALNKMKPMLSDCRVNVMPHIAGQGTGAFHLLRDGDVVSLHAERSIISPEQLTEEQILELAAGFHAGLAGAVRRE